MFWNNKKKMAFIRYPYVDFISIFVLTFDKNLKDTTELSYSSEHDLSICFSFSLCVFDRYENTIWKNTNRGDTIRILRWDVARFQASHSVYLMNIFNLCIPLVECQSRMYTNPFFNDFPFFLFVFFPLRGFFYTKDFYLRKNIPIQQGVMTRCIFPVDNSRFDNLPPHVNKS